MKTQSLSISIIFSILFTIITAFIQRSPKEAKVYEMWIFNNASTDNVRISDLRIQLPKIKHTQFKSDAVQTISSFLKQRKGTCLSNEDRVCIAKVGKGNSTIEVLDVAEGAFESTTSIR